MIAGWGEFTGVLGLFLASHAIPSRPALKAGMIARLGRSGYLVLFNAVSLGLLAWLIVAAGRAPYVGLWDQQEWHRWAVNIVMPLAILLGVFGIGTVNPLSFGGRKQGFDPDHPGVAGFVRHPLLWAFLLWASVHLLANGDLAHAILFGGFALLAVLGMIAIDAQPQALGRAGLGAAVASHIVLAGGGLAVRAVAPAPGPQAMAGDPCAGTLAHAAVVASARDRRVAFAVMGRLIYIKAWRPTAWFIRPARKGSRLCASPRSCHWNAVEPTGFWPRSRPA